MAIVIALGVMAAWPATAVARTSVTEAAAHQSIIKLHKRQHWKSQSVINFWNNRGHWALHARHDKCREVKGKKRSKVCAMARRSLRFHTQRLPRIEARIEKLTGPSWCAGLIGNRAIGCRMAYKVWPSEQSWHSLEELWDNESHWDERANNPRSDACGIPQAMNNCSYGYDPVDQIKWGLNYIRGRYNNPVSALSAFYSRSPHWY